MEESSFIDQPRGVRAGEQLAEQKLASYLRAHLPNLDAALTVKQFPSGFSNLTYLLKFGDRQLVLRRPPIGARIKTAHDMGREFRILSHLHPVYRKVPEPLLFCEDEAVIGAPFYVMERVRGIILRAQSPEGSQLTPATMRLLSMAFVENLVEIHAIDYRGAGLGDLGSPQGYVHRQIEGWTKRYYNAQTDDVREIDQLAAWLRANLPRDLPGALIHNDYKYDNLVLSSHDIARVIAVLDWEMATVGDPLMDLGTTLGYWVESTDSEEWQRSGFVLTRLHGNLSRKEVVEYYAERSGRQVGDATFYYAYGLLKIAVIVQQIYFRYKQGLTRDSRFAGLGSLVKACGRQAERAVEGGIL